LSNTNITLENREWTHKCITCHLYGHKFTFLKSCLIVEGVNWLNSIFIVKRWLCENSIKKKDEAVGKSQVCFDYRRMAGQMSVYNSEICRLMMPWTEFELTTLVVIGTNCIGSCKSNYHTITTSQKHLYLFILFMLHIL